MYDLGVDNGAKIQYMWNITLIRYYVIYQLILDAYYTMHILYTSQYNMYIDT